MSSKVSVIIPCYNAEKFISKTLTSVIEQEHDNIEIIAIDNESNDKTYDILEKFSKDHGNIKIDQAENIYPFCWDEARAKGLEISTGDYITTLCSDDYFERDYIKKCVQIMDTLKNKISLFQSPIRGVDINGNEVNRIGHKYNNMEEFKNTAINRCPVTSPTVFYKRELYDKGLIKTNPEKYSGAADYDLYCDLADQGFFMLPVPSWLGYNYRWHDGQATWGMHKAKINYDSLIQSHWREKWNL
jgi:glycosyltransferase involved in cell wall biosynthesis|tara:strand:- start:5547 stop:6278 length:732 start_codon:yes stop_codon:yes gene_type:complete